MNDDPIVSSSGLSAAAGGIPHAAALVSSMLSQFLAIASCPVRLLGSQSVVLIKHLFFSQI